MNCVAAVDNTIVAACCSVNGLYTLDMDNSSDELVAHNSLYGNIWNVFRYQNSCYVVAGSDQKIYRWNLSSHTWHPVTGIPTELRDGCGFSLVASDDRIYMLGGWLNEQAVNRAYVYDMGSDKWQSLPKIPFAGYLCSSVIINNTLYVAGGVTLDSSGKVHSVYEVSALPLTDSCWRRSTRMSYGSATLTVLYDRLIATGGISIDGYAVNKVETFDATSDRWLPVPDMITPRYGHGICVTENNTLAEVGGVEATECEILKLL